MSGRAAEKMSVTVVYLAPDQLPSPAVIILRIIVVSTHLALVTIANLTSSDSRLHRLFGVEDRSLQLQWSNNFITRERCQTIVRHSFQNKSEQNETEIAVDDAFSWLRF